MTLKNIRIERGMSQARLGKLIGISQQSIQRIEAGSMKPSFATLINLAAVFNVTVDDLIRAIPDIQNTA